MSEFLNYPLTSALSLFQGLRPANSSTLLDNPCSSGGERGASEDESDNARPAPTAPKKVPPPPPPRRRRGASRGARADPFADDSRASEQQADGKSGRSVEGGSNQNEGDFITLDAALSEAPSRTAYPISSQSSAGKEGSDVATVLRTSRVKEAFQEGPKSSGLSIRLLLLPLHHRLPGHLVVSCRTERTLEHVP